MRVISLATFCPQLKSPKAGMFYVTCSSTSSMKTVSLQLVLRLEQADLGRRRHTNFEVTAEEIADKEIGLWKLRTVPLPKTDNPLMEWKLCGDKNVCPFLGRLAPRVITVPATSA